MTKLPIPTRSVHLRGRAAIAAAVMVTAAISPDHVMAQGAPAERSSTPTPSAARQRLHIMEGTFRAPATPNDTTGNQPETVWTVRPILGGMYLDLEAVRNVAFRLTIGFDSITSRYRMSLLDAGSGAFDVYSGDFDAAGNLVLENPQFWRATIAATSAGWQWRFARSLDHGSTWQQSGPAVEFVRVGAKRD